MPHLGEHDDTIQRTVARAIAGAEQVAHRDKACACARQSITSAQALPSTTVRLVSGQRESNAAGAHPRSVWEQTRQISGSSHGRCDELLSSDAHARHEHAPPTCGVYLR